VFDICEVINKVVKSGVKWLLMVFKICNFITYYKNSIMYTFLGDYVCKVDPKGRFILPSGFRKPLSELSDGMLIVKKDIYENCLVMYTEMEWKRQVAIIREKLNPYNREHSRFLRNFYRGAAEVAPDNNGRVNIPKKLLDLINVKSTVVITGVDNKIEVWAEENYLSGELDSLDFADQASELLGNIDFNIE